MPSNIFAVLLTQSCVHLPMLTYWINELMNLLAGNSVYVHYDRGPQLRFLLFVFLFLAITIMLILLV